MTATYPDDRLLELCATYLRKPAEAAKDADTGAPLFAFDPPLTTDEQGTFDDLTAMARFGVTVTLAEWRDIKADAAGLKQYLGVASPTAAQTAVATKAIIRVLGTVIRS